MSCRAIRSLLVWALASLGPLLVSSGAGAQCDPIDNPCDPTFRTDTLDCSTAYPAVGTPPVTSARAGFLNFGGPQATPMIQLTKAKKSPYKRHVWVLNSLNHEVSILNWVTLEKVASIDVGLDPSSIAQTRKGELVFVSNWTSDTVSVIDTETLNVVKTIELRDAQGRPLLAEPMGIAVKKDEKAYVASSATNQVAVIDVETLAITKMIDVPTRDPNAIVLDRKNRFLAVAGLSSGNKTEVPYDFFDESLTGLGDPESPITENCLPLATAKPALFDPAQGGFLDPADPDFRDAFNCYGGSRINAFGAVSEPISINPRIPDCDVVIIDTKTDEIVSTSAGMPEDPGTLNYGVAFSRNGKKLYLANTHARNAEDFGDRPFRNRVTIFDVDKKTGELSWFGTTDIDVDPGEIEPNADSRASTPYGIVSMSNKLVAVTAAGADRLVLLDGDGVVQSRLDVGLTPRAVVRESGTRAFVLNAAGFTVQRWHTKNEQLLAEGSIGDNPMPMEERHGFHLFNFDKFSVNRSFSCASCHPHGDTDQLVWLLDCTDGVRATMTLRQIKDTFPHHWSGDKCNGKKIMEDGVSNLFGQGAPPTPCDTDLTWQYIETLRQPPPAGRASDDTLSPEAQLGLLVTNRARYKDFVEAPIACNGSPRDPIVWPRLLEVMGDPTQQFVQFDRASLTIQGAESPFAVGADTESCGVGGCHAQPFSGTGTLEGVFLGGFCANPIEPIEAITFLGAQDRFLTEDDGRGALYDWLLGLDRYRQDVGATLTGRVLDAWGVPKPSAGLKGFLATFFRHPELEYGVPGAHGFVLTDAVERFIQEQASGPSAVLGRQATATAVDPQVGTTTLLQGAADDGKIQLRAVGIADETPVDLVYDPALGALVGSGVPGGSISIAALVASLSGADAVTFTAGAPLLGDDPFSVTTDAQPFVVSVTRSSGFPVACAEGYSRQLADFVSTDTNVALTFTGTNIDPAARVFVNGVPTGASPFETTPFSFVWVLPAVPAGADTLYFQIQNPGGLLSNELGAPVIEPGAAPIDDPQKAVTPSS